MSIVEQWSGREVRALRSALRLTVVEFADHLGVSDRTVSKWEKGGAAKIPIPASQQLLDMALSLCPDDARARFSALTRGTAVTPEDSGAGETYSVRSHKFIPVYVGVDAIEQLADSGEFQPASHDWLECWQAPAPVGNGECRLYAFACGVIVAHLHQCFDLETVTELAVWRYQSYNTDLPWLTKYVAELVGPVQSNPEYVLSAYVLTESKWSPEQLDIALRLMCTPSVLVDRSDATRPIGAAADVEASMLRSEFAFPDVIGFGVPGISIGYAGWSGISYYPLSPERALPAESIVSFELTTQMLWCYSSHILRTIEDGHDPEVPAEYGWRFLRAAHTRLTTARAQETSQHSLMRNAIMDTSDLATRLTQAQDALRQTRG